MEKIELTAEEMQVIMQALFNEVGDTEEQAAELHDKLAANFNRFKAERPAILSFKDE